MATHSSILAWRIHGQTMIGYGPWDRKESDMTEQLSLFFSFPINVIRLPWWPRQQSIACSAGDLGSIPGFGRSPREGNGNPLHILACRIPWPEEPGGL